MFPNKEPKYYKNYRYLKINSDLSCNPNKNISVIYVNLDEIILQCI